MNTFSKTSFRQKMLKGAVMIVILLQAACAVKVTMLGDGPNDWIAPNPSKFVANGSGAALIYSFDMPGEVDDQPIVQSDARMGARIVLVLHDQHEIAGRLLSVRDSALVISTNEEQDHHIDAQITDILAVENKYIQRVIIKGESKVLKGMGLGLQSGAGIGFASDDDSPGFATDDDSPCSEASPLTPCYGAALKPVIGRILFGGAGMIIGGIAGAAASKSDKAIDPAMNHDFSALKPYAQFPEEEPEYLNAIK